MRSRATSDYCSWRAGGWWPSESHAARSVFVGPCHEIDRHQIVREVPIWSTGFCWGYRNTYAGLRGGMTLVENAKPDGQGPLDKFNRLSVLSVRAVQAGPRRATA